MFQTFEPGLKFDALLSMYPSSLKCYGAGSFELSEVSTQYYGFVLSGSVEVRTQQKACYQMSEGMYFSAPGNVQVQSSGELIVIERKGYRGLVQCGGPLEQEGRLTYIDNCRSTVLVHPSRVGEPVLNFLVIPPHTKQSMHIHPTIRLGCIFEGEGEAVFPEKKMSLKRGTVFYLPESQLHCFHTQEKALKILAYHPDSDTGPSDSNHPMLNRTYVKG